MININSLVVFFNDKPLFKPCSFQLYEGESALIHGKNAVGKSSLLKVLLGQVTTYFGTVKLFNSQPKKNRFDILFKQGVRYIAQFPILPDFLTIDEYFEINKELIDNSKLKRYLTQIKLNPCNEIKQLSFGQKRLVEILFALSSNPKLIIVDELFAGISSNNSDLLVKEFTNFTNSGGITIGTAHNQETYFQNARLVELRPYNYEY